VDTVICKHSSVISLTETVSLRVIEDFIFCSKAENVHVITWSFLDKRSTLKSPMTICGMPGVKSFKRRFSASQKYFTGDHVITCTFSAFEQNIKSSITRKLTCLDHIHTRHLNAQQAGVVPIYILITKIWGDLTCTATHSIPYLIVVYFGKFLSSKGHNSHKIQEIKISWYYAQLHMMRYAPLNLEFPEIYFWSSLSAQLLWNYWTEFHKTW
jgi:hypothetical protein